MRYKTAALAMSAVAAFLIAPGTASAATIVPFQIEPAMYGNPNGSFDVPPVRCGVEVGKTRGVATVTGLMRQRWGCLPYLWIRWVNLSNGRTGTAKMSSGLNGIPAEAILRTDVGQVMLTLDVRSPMTPGVAVVWVP
ncbi:hypothetical protein QSJ18_05675 [Gordonia sp. ABSL1-1]|uniref:hypothetical protein n=1 Tax=Gordonia sp. ABSL1-1 TaxID=3053923 RepID=UPI00257257AE|nr:hypothetical protein [Gordonia sp. ABSL1-1]MDL9936225.1 hypothetical protein [Gordonia sp. ABSL1-1]